MSSIRVDLGSHRYDVLVGPIEAGFDRIREVAGGAAPIMVTEPRVFALHGAKVAEALSADPILVPEGEAAKSWDQLHRLLEQLAARNAGRDTPIIALGGGSVGDLTGLAAALFKRGCPIVHAPTTLLAQADSAIGGKTAIDAFGEKNLIGTFHQPALVIADPGFLDTLDPRQLRAGYVEVVKYGLIDDPAFFAWCESNGRGVLAGHLDLRAHAVETSIRSKARIVAGDVEDRSGKRALLNLGHSFGHAIEAEAGIGTILHGEAVALGLLLAFRFSTAAGLCPRSDTDRVAAHLAACGLPTSLREIGLGGRGKNLVKWMLRDKKNKAGRVSLILAHGIGRALFEPSVDSRRLGEFLERAA
ncbi:MAG TPA: 3-dehydroquinate synthase [Sphingomicrobium sp.]|nr:3-dehydroquinate synthase [Sphingomicrobium sp.]